MTLVQIAALAMVQGAAELLPISSSAHVIVAEKLMGLDPTKPEMTLLLVLLHTGTMFAVIFYFWKSWKESFFSSGKVFRDSSKYIISATLLTGITGVLLKTVIEKFFMRKIPHAEIELLFGNLNLIAVALAAAGALILYAGIKEQRLPRGGKRLNLRESCWIGAVQGICLPFRGFSRSGATISTGLLQGISRKSAEEFSFALAVVLTPPVIIREVLRLLKEQNIPSTSMAGMAGLFLPGLVGLVLSFAAGLLALKWLSSWLEKGRWYLFGIYCLVASVVVFFINHGGLW
jgi:undecaprenyl-diphosphatase